MKYGRAFSSFAIAACLSIAATSPAIAQQMTAHKRANVTYHMVEFIKFKEGMRDRAGEIVEKYFAPASKASGTPEPFEVHMQGGDWDYVLVWPLKGGMADLEWEDAPDDVAWMGALNKIAGGAPASKKLLDEWNGLIQRRVTSAAHMHIPGK